MLHLSYDIIISPPLPTVQSSHPSTTTPLSKPNRSYLSQSPSPSHPQTIFRPGHIAQDALFATLLNPAVQWLLPLQRAVMFVSVVTCCFTYYLPKRVL